MAARATITVTIKDFDSFKRTLKEIRRFKWTHGRCIKRGRRYGR